MKNFFIFDIETQIARARVMHTEKPPEVPGQSWHDACQGVLDRICAEKNGTRDQSCFVPARFHEPVAIVGLLVDEQMNYITHCVLAPEAIGGQPNVDPLIRQWWDCYNWVRREYGATLVSFNGTRFDLPVLEITGLEHGCDLSQHINPWAKVWENPRSDRAPDAHIDLLSLLAAQGTTGGNLNFWCRLMGLPGKLDTAGDMVQQLLEQKKLAEIADYCVCDVLNTYGLFWRVLYRAGFLPADIGQNLPDGRYQQNPIFVNTVERLIAGRGPEPTRLALQLSQVPF